MRRSFLIGAMLMALLATTSLVAVSGARAANVCGAPQSEGSPPVATDCLFILKAAVGQLACLPCVCDVNTSLTVTATDALACLKVATGSGVSLSCPMCAVTTTSSTSTSSSSMGVSKTTTTTLELTDCVEGTTCGAFKACDRGDACTPNFCYQRAEGGGVCGQEVYCPDLAGCQTSSDCADGAVCIVNSCCFGSGVCLPAAALCDAQQAERAMRAPASASSGPTTARP